MDVELKRVFLALYAVVTLGCSTSCPEGSGWRNLWEKREKAALANNLSSWRDGRAKKALVNYVEFYGPLIPPEKRVAVFDFDGTLFCERAPTYFDWYICARHVLDNPSRFSRAQTVLAERVVKSGKIPPVDGPGHELSDTVWRGMTLGEYRSAIRKYADAPMWGFSGMSRRDSFFVPMLQVVEYLKSKGWKVFICTGTDRWIVRELIDGKIDIPMDRIIGSSFKYDVNGEGKWAHERVTNAGGIASKNLRGRKVVSIFEEIGVYPSLVFGNSSGDYEMADACSSPKRHMRYFMLSEDSDMHVHGFRPVFMVLCDDVYRDYGDIEEAMRVRLECERRGWVPVSMKDDWKQIYKAGAIKKPGGPR